MYEYLACHFMERLWYVALLSFLLSMCFKPKITPSRTPGLIHAMQLGSPQTTRTHCTVTLKNDPFSASLMFTSTGHERCQFPFTIHQVKFNSSVASRGVGKPERDKPPIFPQHRSDYML